MPRVAIVGCCHGELDKIYRDLATREAADGRPCELLLIGGDFQACRNHGDLQCMAVPHKYRRLGDFQDYYAGRKHAPVLTLFVGGNHEASNYMQELPHGGFVAPNIYYLGHASVVRFGGLRIAGLSGIYDRRDLVKGRHERPPYTEATLRSVYHTRQFDVDRLLLLPHTNHRLDVVMSHDWPCNIYRHGDQRTLLRQKPYFRKEVERGELGSPANEQLLHALKPRYWFSAHLHVRFEATVRHAAATAKKRRRSEEPDEQVAAINPDEIELEMSSSDDGTSSDAEALALEAYRKQALADMEETSFLALDKCLPNRKWLEVKDITVDQPGEARLEYDREWLAIVRAMSKYASTDQYQKRLPSRSVLEQEVEQSRQWVDQHFGDMHDLPPFEQVAPENSEEVKMWPNSQTAAFCRRLGI